MTHAEGELKVKALQKEFLCWIEHNEAFRGMDPIRFNDVRKRIFRATFDVFRLGVVGVNELDDLEVWRRFSGWMDESLVLFLELSVAQTAEIRGHYFHTALEAFRTGALVDTAVEK